MKKLCSSIFVLAMMLCAVPVVHAQIDLNLDGLDINIDGDTVQVDTGEVRIDTATDEVLVDTGDTTVDVSGDTVEVRTPGTDVNVSESGSGAVSVTGAGADIVVSDEVVVVVEEELSVQLSEGTVNVKTAEMLLEIDEEDEVLIQTDADVRAFAKIKADSTPAVAGVNVSDESVSVTYTESGNVLGVFPTTFETTVNIDNDGSVSVDRPWYAGLVFGTKTEAVQSAIAARVQTEGVTITSQPLLQARYVDVATDAVRVAVEGDSVSVDAGDVSVEAGDGSADIEVTGANGEYIRISDDLVNISL